MSKMTEAEREKNVVYAQAFAACICGGRIGSKARKVAV